MSISAWPAVPTSWCCTSIVMPTCFEHAHHLGAQVLELVHRRDREVALLVPRLVREVRARRRARARGPSSTRPRPSRGSSNRSTGSGRSARSRRCRTRLRARSTRCRRDRSTRGTPRPSARCSAGRGVYDSPVSGSRTKQLMFSVGCWRNGSMTAVFGSGIRSMSDSWISWKPRIDEPSKPRPSSNTSSVSSCAGIEKCCIKPGRSQNRTSTISMPLSLMSFRTSPGVRCSIGRPPSRADRSRAPVEPASGALPFATSPGRCTPCR